MAKTVKKKKKFACNAGHQVQSLGQEDSLQKEMATHSSVLGLENPRDRGAWWAAVYGVAQSRTRLKRLSSNSSSSSRINFGKLTVSTWHRYRAIQ